MTLELFTHLFCALIVLLLFLIRFLGRNHLSVRMQYKLWDLLLFAMAVPLWIPIWNWLLPSFKGVLPETLSVSTQFLQGSAVLIDSWLLEETQLAESHVFEIGRNIFWGYWSVGAIFLIVWRGIGIWQLQKLCYKGTVPPAHVYDLFQQCQKQIAYKGKIYLRQSSEVAAPLCHGHWIIVPEQLCQSSQQQILRYSLLHELVHLAQRDSLRHIIACALQVLYWCNPLIWLALTQMRKDRERCCDWLVLHVLTAEERFEYGMALLQTAQYQKPLPFTPAFPSVSKRHTRCRIEGILKFQPESQQQKQFGKLLFAAIFFLICLQLPILANAAVQYDTSSGSPISITELDAVAVPNHGQSSVVICNTATNQYWGIHPQLANQRLAPCSTYKIYSALYALETRAITPENTTRYWDGQVYPIAAWNQNQTLRSAMQYSVNWYFQQLDEQAGVKSLQQFYQTLGYGNGFIGNNTANYWDGSALRISPLEQVQLLNKLARNDFEFTAQNLTTVKEAILLSQQNDIRLYGKTGTGKRNNETVLCWLIGLVEQAETTYSFAICLQDFNGVQMQEAVQLLTASFAALGISVSV